MRTLIVTVAAGGALFLAADAVRAQGLTNFVSGGHTQGFSSGSAQKVINTPVDTRLAVAPFPSQSGAFNLTNMFKGFSMPSFPPRIGTSPLPSPDSFPSTKYPNGKPVPFRPVNNFPGFVPTNNRPS
ncbi:MAG: hypothetical protein K2R98_22005 [Gemmataceae bacterium]|nr:hypothetical protein [Gemmataceae bacterium]